jgi:hypothetical protein
MLSNTLGMLLFLPLAVILYTTVVTFAAQKGVIPSILSGIQGQIWYIMGGFVVLALLITGAAFMLSGGGTAKAAKKPKPKKAPKAPKAKKVKKPKEPKKPKKAKKAKKAKKS